MAWCFEDESNALADAVLEQMETKSAIVPAIWPLDVGNVLLVAYRRGRLSEADSSRFLSMLADIAAAIKRKGQQKAATKVSTTMGLPADVLEHFKAEGKGWQTRIGDVL